METMLLDIPTILTFMISTALIVAIPGPTVLMIVAAGLAGGRRGALGALFAIIAADMLLIAVVAGGFGAIAQLGGATVDWLTAIGGLVLVVFGLLMFRARRKNASPQGSVRVYSLGSFLATVANPKSLLFFAAFLPQFVDPSRPIMPQYLVLAALFFLAATPVGLAYGLGAGWLADSNGPFRHVRDHGPRVAGLFLIGLGAVGLGRVLL